MRHSNDRRAPADTPCHARRPPAFCLSDLSLCSTSMGAWYGCSSLRARAPNRRRHRSASRFQACFLGRRGQSIRTQEAAGRRWNRRSREFRTPEREVRSPTEGGLSWGFSPWTRYLGTFSGERESTPPVGAGPDKLKGLPAPSGKETEESRRNISYLIAPI